jgi:hypothetical protein
MNNQLSIYLMQAILGIVIMAGVYVTRNMGLWGDINRRYPRLYKAIFYGMLFITTVNLVGLGLELIRVSPWLGSNILGGFLFVTGIQIVLWLLGIRLELLANVESDISVRPER